MILDDWPDLILGVMDWENMQSSPNMFFFSLLYEGPPFFKHLRGSFINWYVRYIPWICEAFHLVCQVMADMCFESPLMSFLLFIGYLFIWIPILVATMVTTILPGVQEPPYIHHIEIINYKQLTCCSYAHFSKIHEKLNHFESFWSYIDAFRYLLTFHFWQYKLQASW